VPLVERGGRPVADVPGSGPAERSAYPALREVADQAFSRAAGAPLVPGNAVRLLRDARENYPVWLEAIAAARQHVHLESYFIQDDATGATFADALAAAARRGVRVRVVYDWMGALGRTRSAFWARLRSAGVEVRCYNPPRVTAPFGWVSRDHRKTVAVDGRVAFVTGLCVGREWVGDPARGIAPWRDTGVQLRGPAVGEVERAFAAVWATLGEPVPAAELPSPEHLVAAGDVSVRIVASLPATAGMLRVDQLVAALARERVWLADAYYAGTTAYVQALRGAAGSGVDVRLLVPGASDIPLLKPLSRAGYRTLLEAGVRVFEWNGTMLHAKTAVADGRWSRVGSTNLNVASWFGNCELDAMIEDEAFAAEMEAAYLEDLANATEIVLDVRRRPRPTGPGRRGRTPRLGAARGSAGRATAGAVRLGHTLGAAFTGQRTLGPVEARVAGTIGAGLVALAALFALFPRLLAYPAAALLAWIGLALLRKAYLLRRERRRARAAMRARRGAAAEGRAPESR
jgi:cardiolipin synthase